MIFLSNIAKTGRQHKNRPPPWKSHLVDRATPEIQCTLCLHPLCSMLSALCSLLHAPCSRLAPSL